MDFMALLGLKSNIKAVLHRHPELIQFLTQVRADGVQKGTVIVVEIKQKNKSKRVTLSLTEQDVQLINKLFLQK